MNSLRRTRHHRAVTTPPHLRPFCRLLFFLSVPRSSSLFPLPPWPLPCPPCFPYARFATRDARCRRPRLTTTPRFMTRDILYPKYYARSVWVPGLLRSSSVPVRHVGEPCIIGARARARTRSHMRRSYIEYYSAHTL